MTAWLDVASVRRLQDEFARSMRWLLFELCEELETDHGPFLGSSGLPVEFFRLVGRTLRPDAFRGWKVVGWLEELNDLVYFLDVERQRRRERTRRAADAFAQSLFATCEVELYEHHYMEDLFPHGLPDPSGLGDRLRVLCRRLAARLAQDSVGLVPGLASRWVRDRGRRSWELPCDLRANLERAEDHGWIPLGLHGTCLRPPAALREALRREAYRCRLVVRPGSMSLRVGGRSYPLPVGEPVALDGWRLASPEWIRRPDPAGSGGMTLGPTLVHGTGGQAARIRSTPPEVRARIARALAVLDGAWPEGAALVSCLTSRVIPLRAPGVVSYSYRHRPGLSFINCFERDDLDLVDDLLHENSHHHLNLLLRKARLYRGDGNQEVFYSPWRRSLRPLRGILHATFTFTMGTMLFARLSSPRDAAGGATLPARHLLRARFRGLEELASVRYALRDLRGTATRLGWLTPAGRLLADEMARAASWAARALAPRRREVERSGYGPRLHRHERELEEARRRYRLKA